MLTKGKTFFHKLSGLLRSNPLSFFVVIGYCLCGIMIASYIVEFILVFLYLDDRVFIVNPFFVLILILTNFSLFPLSTLYDELNFNRIKQLLLSINYWCICLCLLSMLFHYTSVFIFPKVFSLKVTPFVSVGLIVSFARYIELVLCGFTLYGMIQLFVMIAKNKDILDVIYFFRLSKYIDFREDKEYQYDLLLGRNLETKENVILYEDDRYLHMTDDGSSGTGKSSMLLLTGICRDLDTKQRNERMQKKAIRKLLKEGKVYHCGASDTFNILDYAPYPMYQEEYDAILKKYRSAGQTIMAPDASMLDKVYKLAKARGFKVNRIDPSVNEKGEFKEGFIGFNPLFISPEIANVQDRNYVIAVDHRASVYRDVMQQLYELDGKGGDPYFTGLNKAANYNMTVLCILCYPFLHHRQANPVDCLRELNNLQPIEIEREIETKDAKGNIRPKTITEMQPNPHLLELLLCYNNHMSEEVHHAFDDSIQMYFDSIFLQKPARGQVIYDQSLGLRQLVQSFVLNPNIRPIITAPDDHTIIISEALKRGEITIFNFYHAMGTSLARVFGLFFLINFDTEVKGRLVDDEDATQILTPHFFRLDELPVILHPIINSQISLYRKYKVSCEYAFQSLGQMAETPATKFLASCLMQCATQVIFGRTNLEEMRLYNELGGIRKENIDQVSYSEGSIWLDGGMTQTVRGTATDVDRITTDDIRRRNFGECTIFFTRGGAPMDPIISKLSFIEPAAFKKQTTKDDYFPLDEYPVLEDEREVELDIFNSNADVSFNEITSETSRHDTQATHEESQETYQSAVPSPDTQSPEEPEIYVSGNPPENTEDGNPFATLMEGI